MPKATYVDPEGRKFLVDLPEGVNEDEAHLAPIIGPPHLDEAFPDLPRDVMVRIHNGLFDRGLFTRVDIEKRRKEVVVLLEVAFGISVEKIHNQYVKFEPRREGEGQVAGGLAPFPKASHTYENPDRGATAAPGVRRARRRR